jgi:hypothetical protein
MMGDFEARDFRHDFFASPLDQEGSTQYARCRANLLRQT